MAPHSCPRSLISAISHRRSASSQAVYHHITRGWLQQSYPGMSQVLSTQQNPNLMVIMVLPLIFRMWCHWSLSSCEGAGEERCLLSASSDTMKKQTCILGSHELGQLSFILHKIFFPPTSAVQWRLQLGHTHWWGEGTKAAWPVWKPFNEESVKEMPPCPPPSWLLHTLRESFCMKSPWRSFGWSSLKVWAWGWYEVIDEQILELRASKLICKNGLIRGSVVPS